MLQFSECFVQISESKHSYTQVLWPYLLQTLLPVQYTTAIAPVCKSLAYLAAKKREEESADYNIDFVVQGKKYCNTVCLLNKT